MRRTGCSQAICWFVSSCNDSDFVAAALPLGARPTPGTTWFTRHGGADCPAVDQLGSMETGCADRLEDEIEQQDDQNKGDQSTADIHGRSS